jgi:hypothetical protein
LRLLREKREYDLAEQVKKQAAQISEMQRHITGWEKQHGLDMLWRELVNTRVALAVIAQAVRRQTAQGPDRDLDQAIDEISKLNFGPLRGGYDYDARCNLMRELRKSPIWKDLRHAIELVNPAQRAPAVTQHRQQNIKPGIRHAP